MVSVYAHVVWAAIPFYMYSHNLALSMTAALISTLVTDRLGHTGFRRNFLHWPLAIVAPVAVAMAFFGQNAVVAGVAAGLTHIVFDMLRGHYHLTSFLVFVAGVLVLSMLMGQSLY